ncbi:MAG: hypothetical protein NVV59_03215 [Chitinophagaceae bacterium]|nr:hypothetical protein [Chitinophagaceae bacterium]
MSVRSARRGRIGKKFEREQRARREKERQANVAAAVRNEEVNARTRIINGKSVYLATVPARLASTDIEIVQQDSLFGLLQKRKAHTTDDL